MVAFGGGDYTHYLDWWLNWQDVGRNVSSMHFKYWIRRNTSSGNGAFNGGTKRFTIWINHFGDQNEYRSYDFRKYQDLTVVEFDREIGHDGNGYQSVGTAASFEGHSQYFPSVHSGNHWFDLPRIPKRPGPVSNLQPMNIGQRAGGVQYSRGNDNGSGLVRDRAHWYEGGPAGGGGTMIWDDAGPQGYTSPVGVQGAPTLKPLTNYWVYIRSENAIGVGDWVSTSFQTAAGIPSVPRNVLTFFETGSMIRHTWAEPASYGAAISSYDIQYSLDRDFRTPGTITVGGSARSTTYGPLSPNKQYFFRIRAVNSDGFGPWYMMDDYGSPKSGLSVYTSTTTRKAASMRRWDGSAWRGCSLTRWDGNTWAGTK